MTTSSSSDSDFHVTFSLPSSAAALLKELADGGNQGLRDLGVVSVHINSPAAFHDACTVPSRKSARESEAPLSANNTSSHLDKLSLSCHSFPSHDDLENTRQNIRHYLTMQMADNTGGGNVDYAVPNSNASTPMQPPHPPPLDMPRHIPDMRPVNTLGHSLPCADASQLPVGHRMDPARGPLVSEVDHGHQKRNADAECWKPACSSYWNWQQNPYRLAYADVAVDGYGSHSGLARPVSPMYARSPPYAFNSCSPRMRTGYQMLPPSHFQEPFGHVENERAWQHTSHTTTSPYLMNLLHSNSSHAARNQRLAAGPFETVLAMPSGQTKKKFHRSRKDVTSRSGSHAADSSNALGSGSTYDGPGGPLSFGPDHSSFAFPMAPHSACRPDGVEQQNQQIYAAAQSAYYVNKSQANAFSPAPSHVVSTSCLLTSPPPAFAMPISTHAATTATFVTSPSDSVTLTPAHAMLTTTCAASTSRVVLSSTCSESPRATDKSAAVGQLTSTSTKLMSHPAHAVSTPAHLLSASHVFLTSPHVMSTPRHVLYTSAHAVSLPKDVISVPLRHVTPPVSSQNVSETSENAFIKPIHVTSVPSVGIASPALAISTVKQIVANSAPVTTTRTNVISPLAYVGSAHITPQFAEQQYFRSNYSGPGFGATDEYRPDWGSKSKSVHCSFKETSANLNTSSHAEQLCNGEFEKFPDLTQQMNKTTCSVGKNPPLAILPAVHFMGSNPIRDQDLISCRSEFVSARERLSADIVANPVRNISNEVVTTKAIISRKPEDAESQQPDTKVNSSICNPSSTVGEMLKDTLSSASSSHANEMTSTECKGSISATTINETPMSIGALHRTKELSLRGQMLCNLDIVNMDSDHGKKMPSRSEESGSVLSPLLPPIISNSSIGQKAAEEEMRISTHGVADSVPTTVDDDDEQARFQRVDIVVQENFNSEKLATDGSKATVSSGRQSVCNDKDMTGSFKPTVGTLTATSDSVLESNGMVHEKDNSLDLTVSIEQTLANSSQNDDHSQQALTDSAFQTKTDANFDNDMHENADETSSSTKIDAENTLLSAPKMQTRIQNAYSNAITPGSNSEQLNCSNGKEIRSNTAASSNGVESSDAARMSHVDENVCSVIMADDDALRLPMSTMKTPIDTPSNQRDNVSGVVLRKTGNENLAVNVESASQDDIDLLDANVKLVGGREAKNCTDNADDGKVLEVVDKSERGTVECVQTSAQLVNLRLKLLKEELIQKVSQSFEESSSKKNSHVPIAGESCSVPVLQRCKELSQKTTSEDDNDGQRSCSPRAAACDEVTGLIIKPCISDATTATITPSECGQKNSVLDVFSSGDERNLMGAVSVFQCVASSICGPSTSDAMVALHSKQLMANCNALLPAASTRQISSDSDHVRFDGTVSEQKISSDRIQPHRERCKSADFDVTALRHDDATAGSSCHGVGIQSNGLIPEMTDGLNFSECRTVEQLRMVVSPRTVAGFSRRHCVADAEPVSHCSAQTVSTFALNSPSRKEVSLSSEALPSPPPPLPLLCLTVKGEDEQCDREAFSQRNSSSGFDDEATSAMHSQVLHSDSKTVSLSITPTLAESLSSSFTSVSLEIVASSSASTSDDTSHSCVRRQSPVSCASLSADDEAYFGNDAKSKSVFDEDTMSGPLPAKRLRTSDTN